MFVNLSPGSIRFCIELPEVMQMFKQSSSLELVIKAEEKAHIKQEIARLDWKHRIVVVLYYYNELSIRDIARITGCFEGTVKSRLSFARKKLRASLEEEQESIVCIKQAQ